MPEAVKLKNGETTSGAGPALPVPGAVSKLAEYPRRARQFLHDVRNQMRLVTWPSAQDVYSTTVVVVITVIFFALYFWVLDTGLSYLDQWLLRYFKR